MRSEVSPGGIRLEPGGSRRGWVEALRDDAAVRAALLAALRDAPFAGLRFETPPLGPGLDARPAEAVLLDTPALARIPADPAPFAGKLGSSIAVFSSLGGDATLIAPPVQGDWGHLAAFARTAPDALAHALLAEGARAALARSAARPAWFSTSGFGVAWLHLRVDDRPKCYAHALYRVA